MLLLPIDGIEYSAEFQRVTLGRIHRMSERVFRIIQGLYILIALYFGNELMIYVYLGIIGFEAMTNWRIPALLSRLRYGQTAVQDPYINQKFKFKFEPERLLRVVVLLFLVVTFVLSPESDGFFPWFIGAMLLMAGVSSICPMVMFFRFLGFR